MFRPPAVQQQQAAQRNTPDYVYFRYTARQQEFQRHVLEAYNRLMTDICQQAPDVWDFARVPTLAIPFRDADDGADAQRN